MRAFYAVIYKNGILIIICTCSFEFYLCLLSYCDLRIFVEKNTNLNIVVYTREISLGTRLPC